MEDLTRRLGNAVAALEGLQGRLAGAAAGRVEVVIANLRGAMEEVEAMAQPECCTLGCGRPAMAKRLHCRDHGGGDYVRFRDGRVIPITVTELAASQAMRDMM